MLPMIYHMQIEDYYKDLLEQMGGLNHQVDVHLDVLTLKFLDFIKNNECKILHITQNMF